MVTTRKRKLKEGELIPLTYDFMFTDIFNKEENVGILEYFLSLYLNIPYEEMKGNLKIHKRELPLEKKEEKNKAIDLLLSYQKKKINIEISNGYPKGNIDRNILYLCKVHVTQLKYGDESYQEIDESIQINLNNFLCNKGKIKESYYFRNKEGKILSKKIRIDFIDLEEAKKDCYNGDELAGWCRLLKAKDEEEFQKRLGEVKMDKETSKKLYDEVKRLSEDDEYVELHTKLSHQEMLWNTNMLEAREEAREEGEKHKAIEIAKSLLKLNSNTLDEISKVTGISMEELEKIKEN